ncbi:DNA invertase Pin-like site-specific DNA recombinase [Paenibacillus sp. V4I9]|uniref:recombinase family protein n=1 Tax=Paenibacillus sp. V4I9 TaxID=3042308 RepID=UPI0027879B00|nr:recombinase family protein [Paenibacillus sp. V4I9]MDQ0885914.1 DNA invertase Pin-like site-specific DNA recombinase [Paenibacillus sp. V4I9]
MSRIGYSRVSTNDQVLDLQTDALNQAGCIKIFEEKASGKNDDRVELAKALEYLREGDALVVYKLDRLARSTKKLIEISELLESRKIELISIRDQIDTTTAVGRAMFKMLAVIAELERDIISERTLAGLAAARARGRKGGRPKIDEKKIKQAMKLYDSRQHSGKEIAELTGVSKATLYREIENRKKSIHPTQKAN